jgi:hypothetical protein
MSHESNPGQVTSTPEAGPIAAGTPTQEPGAGQVRTTPEAGPLSEDDTLQPPTWREHMRGPILGLDDRPPAPSSGPAPTASGGERVQAASQAQAPRSAAEDELRKWPPYSGKPVSETQWEAMRFVAPIMTQAEKLAIQAIDLTGRGLSGLARYLESRRQERQDAKRRDSGQRS